MHQHRVETILINPHFHRIDGVIASVGFNSFAQHRITVRCFGATPKTWRAKSRHFSFSIDTIA